MIEVGNLLHSRCNYISTDKCLFLKVALNCNRVLISRTQSSPPFSPIVLFSLSTSICGVNKSPERLMHGTGYGEASTEMNSPGCKTLADWPSIETSAGARE